MAAWLDKGDNAWQLTAATVVGMQSMPGLVILYGGMVKKKWAVNSAFMALYAFAAVLLCWVAWAYKMSFGEQLLPMWGRAGPALSQSYLLARAIIPASAHLSPDHPNFTAALEPNFPAATLVYFQFVFAAITVIIVAGSLLGRMNFLAWMLFVPLWLTFSYSVSAFSLWGGGFLFHWGVLDFAGGYVIHVASGVAGYVAAFWVGPRLKKDRDNFPPNNILMTLAGAGLLWLGWSGFNGGSALAASGNASMAVLNTHVCTATSLLVWTSLDMAFFGKPSVIGAVQGMTTGLVCITPAAGLVQGWAAIVMGALSGSVPWLSMMVLHKRYKALQYVDDTLGVVHTHALAGILGGLLTGLLAEPTLTGMFAVVKGARGSFYGGGKGADQVGRQLVGALFVVGWNVVVTSLICWLISFLVPLRMSEEELALGDDAAHGEAAYALWAGDERLDPALLPAVGFPPAAAAGLTNPNLRGLHYASAGASPAPSVNPTVHDMNTFADRTAAATVHL